MLTREDCYVGMPVLYYKSDSHVELGIISSFNSDGVPFVRYHTGSTAACTPYYLLRKIQNDYAFQIIRKDVNNELETQKARRIAKAVIEFLDKVNDYSPLENIITKTIENYKEEK